MTSESETMKVDPVRAATLVSQLQSVQAAVKACTGARPVRLVAVSKLKPASDILALHQDPAVRHEHFGENYTQELVQKAEILPKTIKWHFIGGLQSGHCKTLAKIPNLHYLSSLDTLKKAQTLSRVRTELGLPPINVHIQVNTSGESNKSGCPPGEETITLVKQVKELPGLEFKGLMTIGAIARSLGGGENEDFLGLKEVAGRVEKELGLQEGELELSMGMSGDFEGAIKLGSSEVRIGSTIFGERPAKADATI